MRVGHRVDHPSLAVFQRKRDDGSPDVACRTAHGNICALARLSTYPARQGNTYLGIIFTLQQHSGPIAGQSF